MVIVVLMGLGYSKALAPAVLAPMYRTSAPRTVSCLSLRAQEAPPRSLFLPEPKPRDGDYVDMFCRGIIERVCGDIYSLKNAHLATPVLVHRHLLTATYARAGTNALMKTLVLQSFQDKVSYLVALSRYDVDEPLQLSHACVAAFPGFFLSHPVTEQPGGIHGCARADARELLLTAGATSPVLTLSTSSHHPPPSFPQSSRRPPLSAASTRPTRSRSRATPNRSGRA